MRLPRTIGAASRGQQVASGQARHSSPNDVLHPLVSATSDDGPSVDEMQDSGHAQDILQLLHRGW